MSVRPSRGCPRPSGVPTANQANSSRAQRRAWSKKATTRRSYSRGWSVDATGVRGAGDSPERLGLTGVRVVARREVDDVGLVVLAVDEEHRAAARCDARGCRSPAAAGDSRTAPCRRVITSEVGSSSHFDVPGRARSSRIEREPAPSETIALRPFDCAAAWSSVSPPTERPMPPMRPWSTSARVCRIRDSGVDVTLGAPSEDVRVAVALALSAPVEEQDAVAMTRQACAPASVSPLAREPRSRRRRCSKARTSRAASDRRWS